MYLYGCASQGCDQVWRDTDIGAVCPKCTTNRYDEDGNARESVVWFPLRPRLEALLKCPQFVKAVLHEGCRPHHSRNIVSDVYDCHAYQELLGPVSPGKITRMGLLLCMDGFPAFHGKHKGSPSLMPAEFVLLSLPPSLRYDPDNMLMFMLVPHDMSSASQLKYFQYVVRQDLNPLQKDGVQGPDGKVKVKIFGAVMDLKGKEKFYNIESIVGYCSCTTCLVHFDKGPKGPIYCCARRFLPPGHPMRQQNCIFEGLQLSFAKQEPRSAPNIKTTQTIFQLLTMVRRLQVQHYLGQKGPPMLMSMNNFKYEYFNILEWMHNLKCAFDNILDLLVGKVEGKVKTDMKARTTSQALGLFPEIWTDKIVYLPDNRQRVLASLRDDNINRAQGPFIRRWLKICGITMPKEARVDQLRARLKSVRDMASRGEPVPVLGALPPLPWRLSSDARSVVNKRGALLCYPHYMPVCHIGADSFINRAGCWRSASKLLAFLVILVPILRGFVPKFFEGLRRLTYGLRILRGQTCSPNEAVKLHLKFSNVYLRKTDISKAHLLIITGLSIISGCCPVCLLIPALHCLCHYGEGATIWGLLTLLWMFSFERFNKKCKNLTANKKLPFESLSNSLVRDAVARYYRWRRGAPATRNKLNSTRTELGGTAKSFILVPEIIKQITLSCGCRVEHSSVFSHSVAYIGGKHFCPGEKLIPGRRCGSVIVSKIGGRSMYGLVKKFVQVICNCVGVRMINFALVTLLPRPVYPDNDPLTVRINLNGNDMNTMDNQVVLSLNDIQPSRVIVDIDSSNDCLYMMRVDGYDVL